MLSLYFLREKKYFSELKRILPFFIFFSTHPSQAEARLGSHEVNEKNSSNFLGMYKLNNTLESYIVGGYEVDSPNEYPYLVSILEVDWWTNQAFHNCGGTLIAPDVVLTAAHCVETKGKRIVQTGRYNWNYKNGVDSFNVIQTYIHPYFDTKYGFDHDIALVKISGKASKIPVELNGENENNGETVTVVGWGKTSEYGDPSPQLLETKVEKISNTDCKKFYGPYITDAMVCAYGYGKDACQGDSGGPALVKDIDGTKQIGIISWGVGCGENPGVYTNLNTPSVMNFINEKMCQELSPESCENGVFYGAKDSSSWTNENEDVASSLDKCKNVNEKQCKNVALFSWINCYFSYEDCPEVCCPNSCVSEIGCV